MTATFHSTVMSTSLYAIVTCIEYLRGLADQARADGLTHDARLLEQAADGIWREKARLVKESIAAFGAEDGGSQK